MKLESVYLFISYSSNNADSKLLLHKQDFFETKKIKTNKKEKKKKKEMQSSWAWKGHTGTEITAPTRLF